MVSAIEGSLANFVSVKVEHLNRHVVGCVYYKAIFNKLNHHDYYFFKTFIKNSQTKSPYQIKYKKIPKIHRNDRSFEVNENINKTPPPT